MAYLYVVTTFEKEVVLLSIQVRYAYFRNQFQKQHLAWKVLGDRSVID